MQANEEEEEDGHFSNSSSSSTKCVPKKEIFVDATF